MRYVLFLLFVTILSGCKSAPGLAETPFEYKFEKTQEKNEVLQVNKKEKVVVKFDGVPFGQAMSILTQETYCPIVWTESLDDKVVSGTFNGVPLYSVLDVLSRRVGSSVAEVGGVFYVGEIRKEDRAFAVLRLPPVQKQEFLQAVKDSCSIQGAVSVVGSCVWICDTLESLRKVCQAVEMIRERVQRSYVAEVYFIRINEQHFINLSAQLQFRHIDIFSSAFNVEELFSMFLDGDGGTGFAQVSQRPVLYLSEGRKVTFSDGKELTRERRTLTDSGAMEVAGYEKFADGTKLSLLLNRVSDKYYAVDFDLSVSMFDRNDKSTVPAMEKSELKSEGLLVEDGQVYYIGSLKRDNHGKKGGLFSFDFQKSHDMFTIWLRVRELRSIQ